MSHRAQELLGELYRDNQKYDCAYIGRMGFTNGIYTEVKSPIDGKVLWSMANSEADTINNLVSASQAAFKQWRTVPAPKRGELVRIFGNLVRAKKEELAAIITLESGKPWQESLGEVQEVIDVCDFAVGLSRQLYGLTIASERPNHRMMEQWHPLGVVGVVTAFNFPMAVWAWNAALALVCGNTLIWKPSEQTPMCALVCHQLLVQAAEECGFDKNISSVVFAPKHQAQVLVENPGVALVSATGSCAMGKEVAQVVAARMGRYLLELGGNNAMIVTPTANLDLAIRAAAFAALGTTGQRCTTLRRLIVHESRVDEVIEKLATVYASVSIGDPFDEKNLLGPLVSQASLERFHWAIEQSKQQGGQVVVGGETILQSTGGHYVTPAIIKIDAQAAMVQEETFAPILYVMTYHELDEAISIQNQVAQGLSSAIFTQDVSEAEWFLSASGSDCGIANVNIGTSGAEIGGAFGGEKETGGGRESGSDAWKQYMRRATNTINYGKDLPLAQGIRFDL